MLFFNEANKATYQQPFTQSQIKEVAELLVAGKIGILPTDTIYGIHCLAHDKKLIDKLYVIKQRPAELPMITLISSRSDLDKFGLVIEPYFDSHIKRFWPGPNTLIFKTKSGNTRSFRLPKNDYLLNLLKITGPLISTSANIHGKPFVTNIDTAKKNFVGLVEFFVDGGELNNAPSSVYNLIGDDVVKLR